MSNIAELLTFPFNTAEGRKNFLIGCLAAMASVFIPILPSILVYGYIARIIRKISAGEAPAMPDWDNLNDMFINGLRLYGVKLIIGLPLLVILFAGVGVYAIGMIGISVQDDPSLFGTFLPILLLIFGATMCISLPLGIATALIGYPASIHAVVRQSFSAGFKFSEWWPILRINISGFLLAILLTYAISILYSIGIQILVFTIVLLCLLPLLTPVITFYMMLVPEVFAAQAYRDGQIKLAAASGASGQQ